MFPIHRYSHHQTDSGENLRSLTLRDSTELISFRGVCLASSDTYIAIQVENIIKQIN